MKRFVPLLAALCAISLIACGPAREPTEMAMTATSQEQPATETAAPTPTTPPPTETPTVPPAVPIVYYYFVAVEGKTFPAGSVVILPDILILGPTLSETARSLDTVTNIGAALQAMLHDPRNAWDSADIGITSLEFREGGASVTLEGEYFGAGDVTLIAARMQILLTVFAESSVQTAMITLNGENIANLGISHSSEARPDDYTFTRAEVEAFMAENAYEPPMEDDSSSGVETPLPPTSAPSTFLPADLAAISPQNASNLSQVAALPDQNASVVAYSPDSRRFAAGLFRTNQIKIWNLVDGQELFTLGGHINPRIIAYLAFSPDGAQLASGAQAWDAANDSLILWDAASGLELQRFSAALGAISPDWRLVALTRREQEEQVTLTLTDLSSGELLHTLQAPSDIYGVSFAPQGQQVAAKMYHVIQDLFSFWSVESGRLERTLYDWTSFSFSPDGRFIAALLDTGSGGDKSALNIFNAATFKWIKTPAKDADSLWYTTPAFSPDGELLAASVGDQVVLWDTQTWLELASLPVSGPSGCAFSPDGKILTTFSLSGPLQFWGVAGAAVR